MTLLTIRIEGGLLSPDFLETIHDQPGQKPADFGLDARRSLVDEVTAVWSDVRAYWEAFERRRARAKDGESLTSATRETWIIPLLEALGYRLTFQRKAAEIDGRTYALSHRAGDEEKGTPVHIVAFDQKLGERPPAGRGTMSPHALVQDYLNRSDDLWGIVTNGATLRLLRDSVYFSRPSYIEFDLQGMLDGERLDEFILFYRLAHRSRLAATGEDGSRCLLESYHQAAVEQGGRIRDGLRKAVEGAILTLGNGFLSHPKNGDLRRAISDGGLSASGYYQQLLYLIYRLLFLMVAEERNLLVLADPVGNGGLGGVIPPKQGRGDYYLDHYSITRLRRLAEAPLSGPQRFDDLYLSLRTLFQVLRDETQAPALGVPALNGELFDVGRTRHLEAAYLNNRDLLSAIRQLSYFTPEREQVRRRVNYGALDVEELGSVYESLLDEYPVILGIQQQGTPPAGGVHPAPGHRVTFAFVQGTERKTTGSYYTARELVKETLDSALDPVIAERLKAAAESLRRSDPAAAAKVRAAQIAALLAIRVCDSACGSGHFLLAAARRIGRALAQIATGEDEPSPEVVRHWTREAIIHCIYGVDKNPLAVDLCKVALWIEGFSEGKPLTFLDAHIKCGDSLVGVFDLKVLDAGIPDEAFDPVTGDDKAVARGLKRRNKEERGGQLGMVYQEQQAALDEAVRQWQAQLDSPEDTPTQVRHKQAAYRKLQQQEDAQRTACDLWTAAFFTPLTAENIAADAIPTTAALQDYRRQPAAADPRLVGHARALAVHNQFFHWPLEFPHVFASGGFTVTLGNPPWERIKLQEQEFFAARNPEIAAAPNKAARQRLIDALPILKPALALEFTQTKHASEAWSKFARRSTRFPLTGEGDVNTYALFAELMQTITSDSGRGGCIVPTGILTDDSTKRFFQSLMNEAHLVSAYDFDNSERLFPAVRGHQQFCILTTRRTSLPTDSAPQFAFFLTNPTDIHKEGRRFQLTSQDIELVNPNTRTCPVFRFPRDAEIVRGIYSRVPVLALDDPLAHNAWVIRFARLFDMANDSKLFQTHDQLATAGWTSDGVNWVKSDRRFVPLFDPKMAQQYNHRAASLAASGHEFRKISKESSSLEDLQDPDFVPVPLYWVPEEALNARLGSWFRNWLLGFKDVTGTTSTFLAAFTVVPRYGVSHKFPVMLAAGSALEHALLLATCNSLVCEYVLRQKFQGLSLAYFYLKQLPVPGPERYESKTPFDPGRSWTQWISPRVLELVYTSWDLEGFATDMGFQGEPFRWDPEKRFLLRAELEAALFHLYGLNHDEVLYIFSALSKLQSRDRTIYGEYRTREVVIALFDRMRDAQESGAVFHSELQLTQLTQPSKLNSNTLLPASTQSPNPSRPENATRRAGNESVVLRSQPDLFGTPAAPAASAKAESTRPAPRPEPAAQPVLIPTPPQGNRSQRLSRLLTLGRQRTPEAIGGLVAALGDEDEQLRWLAALSLQGIGGGTVISTLKAFIDQAPSAVAREEAERVLGKLTEQGG